MKCENCGNDLQERQKFCSVCGKKVEPIQTCSSCGTKLEPGQKFCIHCGQPVHRVEQRYVSNPKTTVPNIVEPDNGIKRKKRFGIGKGLLIAGGVIVGITVISGIFGGNSTSTSENIGDKSTKLASTEMETTEDAQISAFIKAYGFNPEETVDRDNFMQNAVTPGFKDLRDNISYYIGKGIKVNGLIMGKSAPDDYMEGVTELAYDANEWNELLDTYYAYSCMNNDMDNPGGYVVISEDSSPYANEWKVIYGYPVGVNSKGDVILWGEFFTDEEETPVTDSAGVVSSESIQESTQLEQPPENYDSSPEYYNPANYKYDFGFNTNPDNIRDSQDYMTADVNFIKNNGMVASNVIITGKFTYAGHGRSVAVSEFDWYDSNTMSDLDAYYISDPYGEGKYVVLSAYDSNVQADEYVQVYGTVIDIDKNGVVYIAGQLIETAPGG